MLAAQINKRLNSRISCQMRRHDIDLDEVNKKLKKRVATHRGARPAVAATKENKVISINRKLAGRCRGATRSKVGRAISPWNYLPYTVDELREHLEALFEPGMTWDDMHLWHIDHIKPVSTFTFHRLDDPEFLACFALSNLQPMWASKNSSKGAKYYDPKINPTFPGF